MKLQILVQGAWRVVAPIQDSHTGPVCGFVEELLALSASYQASANGFYAIWEQIGVRGPHCLSTALYHCIDTNNKIYEFIKGDLRVLSFVAGDQVCVCSSVFVKSGRRPNKSAVKAAIALRNQYLADAKIGKHEFIVAEEG